jgi:multiple antibiotic resistance protein
MTHRVSRMNEFWHCFVPLFFAVDAIGVLPMYMSFTEGMERKSINRTLIESIVTAFIVSTGFLFAGKALFSYLGISIQDFMVAGGLLLFIFSVRYIFTETKGGDEGDKESIGVVPIGVPLIAGPAVLTTSIILVNQYSYIITLVSIFLNLVIAGVLFWFGSGIYRFLGKAGTKAVSKIASIMLAAIAIMMVRKGIIEIFGSIHN